MSSHDFFEDVTTELQPSDALFDALLAGNFKLAKQLLQKNSSLCNSIQLEKSVLDIAFEKNGTQLVIAICKLEHCQVGAFFVRLLQEKQEPLLQQILTSKKLGIIDKQALHKIMQTSENVFLTIWKSAATKHVDLVLANVVAKYGWDVVHFDKYMICTDLLPLLQACAMQQDASMAKVFFGKSKTQVSMERYLSWCKEEPVLHILRQCELKFPQCELLDSLVNVNFPVQRMPHILNEYWYSKELMIYLCKIMTNLDDTIDVPAMYLPHVGLKFAIACKLKGSLFPNELYRNMDFILGCEQQGYKWTVEDIDSVITAHTNFVETPVLDYFAQQFDFSVQQIKELISRNMISPLKIFVKRQTLDFGEVLDLCKSMEIISLFVSNGAKIALHHVVNAYNYTIFEYYMEHGKYTKQDLQDCNLAQILNKIGPKDKRSMITKYGICNESMIPPLIMSFAMCCDMDDAIFYFQLLTKVKQLESIMNEPKYQIIPGFVNNRFIRSFVVHVMRLFPKAFSQIQLFDSFLKDEYIRKEKTPIGYALGNSDAELIALLWNNCYSITNAYYSNLDTRLDHVIQPNVDEKHHDLIIESANHYPEFSLAEHKKWLNKVPQFVVHVLFSKESRKMRALDCAQLIRSIKRFTNKCIFKTHPLVTIFNPTLRKFEPVTDKSPLPPFLHLLVHIDTTLFNNHQQQPFADVLF